MEQVLNIVALTGNLAALVWLALCVVWCSRPEKMRKRAVEFGAYVLALIVLTAWNVPAASAALADENGLMLSVWSAAKTLVFTVMMVRVGICILGWYGQREALKKELGVK